MEAAGTLPMRDKIFERNGQIVSRKIAGDLFLVPIRGKLADMQKIFSLNTVGEYVWNLLNKEKNFGDICKGIIGTFEVGREEAEADLAELIRKLLEEDLIREL